MLLPMALWHARVRCQCVCCQRTGQQHASKVRHRTHSRVKRSTPSPSTIARIQHVMLYAPQQAPQQATQWVPTPALFQQRPTAGAPQSLGGTRLLQLQRRLMTGRRAAAGLRMACGTGTREVRRGWLCVGGAHCCDAHVCVEGLWAHTHSLHHQLHCAGNASAPHTLWHHRRVRGPRVLRRPGRHRPVLTSTTC